MQSRPKVLILSLSWLNTQPRVLRQVKALSQKYDLTVVGYGSTGQEGIEEFSLPGLSPTAPPQLARYPLWLRIIRACTATLGRYHFLYWWLNPSVRSAYLQLAMVRFDVVVANEMEAVPLAVRLAKGASVVADLHEYTPGQLQKRSAAHFAYARYRQWLCREYLHLPSRLVTVGHGISKLYEKNWSTPPLEVIRNVPAYRDLTPSTVDYSNIELVYHGLAGAGRGIEAVITAMAESQLPCTLHLYLTGGGEADLKLIAQKKRVDTRVVFHEPVPTQQIAETINAHDVGVVFHQPHTENFQDSLPNKFFEGIQARLALIVSPSPEMSGIVRQNKMGVVTRDFSVDALTEALNSLCPESVALMKEQSEAPSRKYSWDCEQQRFLDIIEESL